MRRCKKALTKDLEQLKNKQTEINNTLEGINSRITEAEKWKNNLEDRMVEITAAEQTIEKRMRRNEESLNNICSVGGLRMRRE